MKSLIFCVYDEKAHAFLQPWFLPTEEMGVRVFSDCVNDAEHNFGRHPADYTLFLVGDWDDSNAVIDVSGGKRPVGNGVEYLRAHSPFENWAVGDSPDAFEAHVNEVRDSLFNGQGSLPL